MTRLPESHDGYQEAWVVTQGGRFELNNPVWRIESIAHSLAQCARFNGHGAFPWSVADHSSMVAALMMTEVGGDPFEGLLHDATECVMSDIPSPFKPQLPDWRAIDARLEKSMRAHYELPEKKSEECKVADWLALFIEADVLMPERGSTFEDPAGLRPKALELRKQGWRPIERDWRTGRDTFLDLYTLLQAKRSGKVS